MMDAESLKKHLIIGIKKQQISGDIRISDRYTN